jgi:hypothetical protein
MFFLGITLLILLICVDQITFFFLHLKEEKKGQIKNMLSQLGISMWPLLQMCYII